MPYEKSITIYERIPIDEIFGKVSNSELKICKVINQFIDQICLDTDDESVHTLSWDQVLMRVSSTRSTSLLAELLDQIEIELHGNTPPETNTEEWERGYERREILLSANGYIFGDPLLKPYCPYGLLSWVFSESVALWSQGLLDEMPAIKSKVDFQRKIDKWSDQDEIVMELLLAKTGEGLPQRREVKRFSCLISVINGYGVTVENFKPGKGFIDKNGLNKIVVLDQLHQDCLSHSPKGLMPVHYPTWKTDVWDEFNKFKKYYKQ